MIAHIGAKSVSLAAQAAGNLFHGHRKRLPRRLHRCQDRGFDPAGKLSQVDLGAGQRAVADAKAHLCAVRAGTE